MALLEVRPRALLARLGELSDLGRAGQLLAWDQQVMMPPAGSAARGALLGTLRRLAHEKLVSPELGALLAMGDAGDAVVRTVSRDHGRALRVPAQLTEEIHRAGADGLAAWLDARAHNDFGRFEPALRRNVELAREYADCFPESEHPYDALLDRYEPGATAAGIDVLFAGLRDGLRALVSELATQPAPPPLPGTCSAAAQREIAAEIATAMGFDEDGFRLDPAAHPFACVAAAQDVRVATRFVDGGLAGLFTFLHELGHALYERQIDPMLARTTLDSGVSLGVHESQSRLWETFVGRGEPFWSHWLPRLRDRCEPALDGVDVDAFVRAINVVRPSLVRVDADEVTYSLHVIARYELELGLVDGTLDTADLPDAWAAKMREHLGIAVPDDNRGVLQDIHWSQGIIGYFPAYAIGNVLAAQLWRALRGDLPDLDDRLRRGDYADVRDWLREKVHRHGRSLTPAELVEQAVGGPLDPAPMLEYLDAKYRPPYRAG